MNIDSRVGNLLKVGANRGRMSPKERAALSHLKGAEADTGGCIAKVTRLPTGQELAEIESRPQNAVPPIDWSKLVDKGENPQG